MDNSFSVGFGRKTVNPEESIPLCGFGNDPQRYNTAITEDICVTCVAVSDAEGNTILMVGMDLAVSHDSLCEELLQKIGEKTGIPKERIYLSATHSHAAPSIGMTVCECIRKYRKSFIDGAVEAAEEAIADRKAARIFVGSIETENMNFIKHYKARDLATGEISYIGDQFGTEKGKTLLEHATIADKTMHVVRFARDGGKDVVMANFRAHPHFRGGYKKYDLSSDYIGAFRMALEAMYDCHAVYFQGACGNINSSSRMPSERRFTTCRSYGTGLAAYAVECIEKRMHEVKAGGIKTARFTVYGEINDSMSGLVKEAAEIERVWNTTFDRAKCDDMSLPLGIRSPYHASAIVANSKRTKEIEGKMLLNVVSIGEELAFATFPGEMFDSISVRIEENSPFFTTLMLCYSTHHVGYLPSAAAYKYTSYETDITRFRAGTGEMVADTVVAELKKLKEE